MQNISSASKGALVITMKPRETHNFNTTAMLFCVIQKRITLIKVTYFLKIYYHTKFQETTLNGTRVTLNSKAHMTTMLILLNVGQEISQMWGGLYWHYVHIKCHLGGERERETHTHTHTQ
jgi:hypothetical protein